MVYYHGSDWKFHDAIDATEPVLTPLALGAHENFYCEWISI